MRHTIRWHTANACLPKVSWLNFVTFRTPSLAQVMAWWRDRVDWNLGNKILWNISGNLNNFISRKCVWKCRLKNGGHLFSASNVKAVVSELFSRGPIGNCAALVQVLTWNRTEAKPFPKPMVTWHHSCKNCHPALALYQKIYPIKPIISIHCLYIYTNISRPQRPHFPNVH